MQAILRPLMSLMPARPKKVQDGQKHSPMMHRLLYSMRELQPAYIAVVMDMTVVPWNDATTRPHVADEVGDYRVDDGKKTKARNLRTYGCCLTTRGTLTFVNPDGLTVQRATISRRDMVQIEVNGWLHCVDGLIDDQRVTVAWRLVPTDIQEAAKTKEQFRAAAAQVLPDVPYTDITPPPPPPEEEGRSATPASQQQQQQVDDVDAELPNAGSADGGASSGDEGEGDEELIDLTSVVEELEAARDFSRKIHERETAALKWLRENPEPQTTTWGDRGTTGASDVDEFISDREQALRLSLLILGICDDRRRYSSSSK